MEDYVKVSKEAFAPIAELDFQGFKKSIEGRKDKEVFEVIKCALCE